MGPTLGKMAVRTDDSSDFSLTDAMTSTTSLMGSDEMELVPKPNECPLAKQATPCFLRRFLYNYGGRRYVFDESLLPQANFPPERRRAQLASNEAAARRPSFEFTTPPNVKRQQSISEEPLPKRRNMSGADTRQRNCDSVASPEDDALLSLAGPVSLSIPDENSVPNSPAADDFATGNEEDHTTFVADVVPTNVIPATSMGSVASAGLDDEELSLLSPTASPKAPAHSLSRRADASGSPIFEEDPDVVTNIPSLIGAFEQLPAAMHRYVLYKMFKRCDRATLSLMSNLAQSALRCDMIRLLPRELTDKIFSYLDSESLLAVSLVSKTWYHIVEGNEAVWRNLMALSQLELTPRDEFRATYEAWGYSGWTEDCTLNGMDYNMPVPPPALNAMGRPVNKYKAIYRRKLLIARNWMTPNSRPLRISIPYAVKDVITCLYFDEERIIAGSDGKYINIYDTSTGRLVSHFDDHEGGVWALKYIMGDILVSGSTDRTVRVWSISRNCCTHVFRGHISTVRCLDVVMPVKVEDKITGKTVMCPPYPVIVTGSRDASVRMWRLPGPDDPDHFTPASEADIPDPFFLKAFYGHENPVRAINGYGDTVVSGSYDYTVRVWKISTGECKWVLRGHQHKVYCAIIDPKRNRCISASMDWNVKVWCLETGTLLYTLEGHTSLVGFLDLNRTTLVSAASDQTLRLWDPERGILQHKLTGHDTGITCFRHDENKVVSASDDSLKLWNIKTGQFVSNLFEGIRMKHIWQVSFDSRRCVSAVCRNGRTFLEVLNFDYNPNAPAPSVPASIEDDLHLEGYGPPSVGPLEHAEFLDTQNPLEAHVLAENRFVDNGSPNPPPAPTNGLGLL